MSSFCCNKCHTTVQRECLICGNKTSNRSLMIIDENDHAYCRICCNAISEHDFIHTCQKCDNVVKNFRYNDDIIGEYDKTNSGRIHEIRRTEYILKLYNSSHTKAFMIFIILFITILTFFSICVKTHNQYLVDVDSYILSLIAFTILLTLWLLSFMSVVLHRDVIKKMESELERVRELHDNYQ